MRFRIVGNMGGAVRLESLMHAVCGLSTCLAQDLFHCPLASPNVLFQARACSKELQTSSAHRVTSGVPNSAHEGLKAGLFSKREGTGPVTSLAP